MPTAVTEGPVTTAKAGTLDRTLKDCKLLAECEVLKHEIGGVWATAHEKRE